MEHAFLDEYSGNGSFLSRLDPRIKIFCTALFMACILSTDPGSPAAVRSFALYGLLLGVLTAFSRIPLGFILKRTALVIPFVFMTLAFVPFLKGGAVAHAFSFGPLTVTATREGMMTFWGVLAKSVLSLLSMILLTASTGFPGLLKALEKMRCPRIILMVLSFMYRYLFLVQDEFMRMRQAKESRSAGGPRKLHLSALAGMAGVLFVRSYERAESVYLAMCSRGFTGTIRTIDDFHAAPKDLAFLALVTVSLIAVRILGSANG